MAGKVWRQKLRRPNATISLFQLGNTTLIASTKHSTEIVKNTFPRETIVSNYGETERCNLGGTSTKKFLTSLISGFSLFRFPAAEITVFTARMPKS